MKIFSKKNSFDTKAYVHIEMLARRSPITGKLKVTPIGEMCRRRCKEKCPRLPEELVDALQDRIHPISGRLLTSKLLHFKRKEGENDDG